MPPATTMSTSPVAIPCAASMTAFRPDPQTLLMFSAATWSARPPPSAAWRAGFCPTPALTTLPMMHSSTIAGSMPARRIVSATTMEPNWGAEKSFSAPRNFPVGVRTALTMTEFLISGFRGSRVPKFQGSRFSDQNAFDRVVTEQRFQARQDDAGTAHDFACPVRVRCLDDQDAGLEPNRRHTFEVWSDGGAPCEADLAG